MSTPTTHTIRLHRVLRATPERVYRAFLDADAMTKWLPPNGFTGKVHHMDAKVGGTYKCRSQTSAPARVIPSAESILNWCHKNASVTQIDLTTRTCPEKFRRSSL